MSLAGPPPPPTTNPLRRLWMDVRNDRRHHEPPFPPGDPDYSLTRTRRMVRDPLGVLLEAYERYGPVFTLRIFHERIVWVLGPEANHHVLVANAANFVWREGHFRELLPLLGDGLLTIDGDFHRRSRRIVLPAFHHERIAGATGLMIEETERAMAGLRDGAGIDVYRWTRSLAMRIAMRALFGLDPDRERDLDAAAEFHRALAFYGKDYWMQVPRGPGTPFARMQRARAQLDRLVFGEIARRRTTGERGEDVLSLLLDAEDEDGSRLSDRHVRDQVMTLLFAGHDTTTATIAFLVHELAGAPVWADRVAKEGRSVLDDRALDAATLMGGGLPELDMVIDEVLRLYPAAWVGPRRSVAPFAIAGVGVPGGVSVNYSSWASHRLPDVWEAPDAFRPQRFTPEARARIPKGAYVPFGGGSRICLGMRFGQLEIKVIATLLLRSWRFELEPGWQLAVRQTPTIGPAGGLPVRVRRAPAPAQRAAA
ncbi:MAG TPA: cytochrome P450 [Solirubrobacteraceae bacterium]|nr:cytochrome P450 [Solirubrobacteraceae bacterium]